MRKVTHDRLKTEEHSGEIRFQSSRDSLLQDKVGFQGFLQWLAFYAKREFQVPAFAKYET